MTISYKWLNEYLPVQLDHEKLSMILTSVGLEVEKMETYEEVKGGLEGLVIGEVLQAEQHPNADKLKVTRVNTGTGEELQIVCGAPNVAAGQKVIVATIGTTIFPVNHDPITMKLAKIRGVESHGMICAEDEIGLGNSHDGIMILPGDVPVGIKAAEYFSPYSDIIYHIGLTPNRMDAMSHWGVARDICAYLSHHDNADINPVYPTAGFDVDDNSMPIEVVIENKEACRRYSGVSISGVEVKPSPEWLKKRLKSIGLRPVNNIVDITNFIQHETGQPLHAFDLDTIAGKKIIVRTAADQSVFTTLDEKERKLHKEDLMICDADNELCIAGVFGGMNSGVISSTKNIFLESAWFDPIFIRKTSFRHGLRTDAATRFEKGTDISATVPVLKRAAMMIKEIAGGKISSEIADVYPDPAPKKQVLLKYDYLLKISGKHYPADTVRTILLSLGFEISNENDQQVTVLVPYHKPDISLPADLVEEILRIDGLDNIPIPTTIRISPSVEKNHMREVLKEKISQIFAGLGFSEILTNSITNSNYFSQEDLSTSVRLLNNLSSELDIMRPSMLHTALEVISFNLNRKNNNLRFFEFGKTYQSTGVGEYQETDHFCLYLTGDKNGAHWRPGSGALDIFYLKGLAQALLNTLNVKASFELNDASFLSNSLKAVVGKETIMEIGQINQELSSKFEIRQPVFFLDLKWEEVISNAGKRIKFREIPKYPSVERDLALVVPKTMQYGEIEQSLEKLKLNKLRNVRLFDVFESEKLGTGKKSMAISLTFMDEEKTLTDKEIDSWMSKIMSTLQKDLQAEIRK
jgi:phenylalanyl-tRNA synthetase beta chain